MSHFPRSLALELAERGSTANCVAPGFTRTSTVEAIPEEIQERTRSDVPLERFAEPAEIVDPVRFFASRESSYVAGEVIDINGGVDL